MYLKTPWENVLPFPHSTGSQKLLDPPVYGHQPDGTVMFWGPVCTSQLYVNIYSSGGVAFACQALR